MATRSIAEPEYVLRHDWKIGAFSAEDDDYFLSSCFFDAGYITNLEEVSSPAAIVVGRTGAGKSALLSQIHSDNFRNSTYISPDAFSLRFISGGNLIQTYESLGIKLDLIYQFLWKHVLCVELIQLRFKNESKSDVSGLFTKFFRQIRDTGSRKQVESYLEKWGEKDFWKTTEKRASEISQAIERQIAASAQLGTPGNTIKASDARKMTAAEKAEFVTVGQRAVEAIQVQELNALIDVLNEDIFRDDKRPYYILIDDLDGDWAEDIVRYKLIRALVETIKRLRKIHNVKIIISMRTDLLEKVFRETRDAGFQQDKYRDYILTVRWADKELREMADLRVRQMFRYKYQPNAEVGIRKLFTAKVDQTPPFKYMVDRTLNRPRDIIAFTNEVIQQASGTGKITAQNIKDAEIRYSQERLEAVEQEWLSVYPEMPKHINILRGMNPKFTVASISMKDVESWISQYYDKEKNSDPIANAAHLYLAHTTYDHEASMTFFRPWIAAFYTIGLLGVRQSGRVVWSDTGGEIILDSELTHRSELHVHPMVRRALGVHGR